jgi:hypothetical protein
MRYAIGIKETVHAVNSVPVTKSSVFSSLTHIYILHGKQPFFSEIAISSSVLETVQNLHTIHLEAKKFGLSTEDYTESLNSIRTRPRRRV